MSDHVEFPCLHCGVNLKLDINCDHEKEITKLTLENQDLIRQKDAAVIFGDQFKKSFEESNAENFRLRDALEKYGTHDRDCILSFFEAGEPTIDGGYRTKIKGKWYQSKPVDETPKCNCGFKEALASPPKEDKPI